MEIVILRCSYIKVIEFDFEKASVRLQSES